MLHDVLLKAWEAAPGIKTGTPYSVASPLLLPSLVHERDLIFLVRIFEFDSEQLVQNLLCLQYPWLSENINIDACHQRRMC